VNDQLAVISPDVLSVDADFNSVVEIIMSFVDLVGAFVPALGAALSLFAQGVIGTALTEGAAAVKGAAPVDESKVVGNHIVATRTIPVWKHLSAGTAHRPVRRSWSTCGRSKSQGAMRVSGPRL
jgi:hypothetical protein